MSVIGGSDSGSIIEKTENSGIQTKRVNWSSKVLRRGH